ncbi:MAG: hypothetical protein ACRDT4_12130 [Micromonosporaceae bacterium]
MTATNRDQLSTLIDQADQLEQLAKRVQHPDESDAEVVARELERQYRAWYAKALVLLPSDLLGEFRSEYEGSFFSPRIKDFLQGPLQPNILYDEDKPEVQEILDPWQHPFNASFRGPLLSQKQILLNALERLGAGSEMVETLDRLQVIMERIPFALAVLARPIRQREGIEVRNEYDMQRIVHAILVLLFEDVRPEEYSPSRAGSNTRIDFIVKDVRVAVEAKMTRDRLGAKELGDELAADILRYQKHPDAGALFAIVYDPSKRVMNPRGFERDMRSDTDHFPVRVVVAQ